MTNYSLEFCAVDELCDCEPANRNDKTWSQNFEFGFHPEAWWPDAERQSLDDGGSPLFVRGAAAEVKGPVRFPDLAHT